MINLYSIQISTLLSEAIFCVIAGIIMGFNKVLPKKEVRFVMYLNFVSGLLLLSDFFAYLYRGQEGTAAFYIVRLSNFLVYFLQEFIILLFTMYICYQMFGSFEITSNIPCKKRMRVAYAILIVGMLMVVISQLTHMYYYFDEDNMYHRGSLFYLSIIIPFLAYLIDVTILFQYHKKVNKLKLITLVLVEIIPGIGIMIQTLVYGMSFLNIAIGLAFIMLFIESNVNLNYEVVRVAETEVRTGLANEHGCILFIDSLDKNKKTKYACAYFDINNFRLVNRKYGMARGNEILTEYANIIKKLFEKDELLGRQGSDKFIAIVKKDNLPKFIEALSGTEVNSDIRLSATAGIYEIEDDVTGEWAISNAAVAYSYAKNDTKKQVEYFNAELKKSSDDAKAMEEDIAFGLKNEEFLVYYQPKVNSRTYTLCGAEALVRWKHNGEFILPYKFIPIMEKNDSMCDMDFYMLRHVCADLAKWIEMGLVPPTVSVNFSRRNLSNKDLAKQINDIVVGFHIPKKMIEIEITETIDEFPISVMKNFIDELHHYGISVAVDDFGSGSSSLALLREVTFDTLKIDKGFVDRAYAKDLTILSYIIKLAKAINLEVLAEGVETKTQIDTLLSLGCEIIQGYYFDKPLPKDEMEERIIRRVYTRE